MVFYEEFNLRWTNCIFFLVFAILQCILVYH